MSESWQECPDMWLWELVGIARPKLQTTLFNFSLQLKPAPAYPVPILEVYPASSKGFLQLKFQIFFCKLSNLVKGKTTMI